MHVVVVVVDLLQRHLPQRLRPHHHLALTCRVGQTQKAAHAALTLSLATAQLMVVRELDGIMPRGVPSQIMLTLKESPDMTHAVVVVVVQVSTASLCNGNNFSLAGAIFNVTCSDMC